MHTMAPAGHSAERVTVTMPAELVAGIDRLERNRSLFIADAVRHG
jgi:metal-responsive CopG/Arc/MetJ family transcriptional regulator